MDSNHRFPVVKETNPLREPEPSRRRLSAGGEWIRTIGTRKRSYRFETDFCRCKPVPRGVERIEAPRIGLPHPQTFWNRAGIPWPRAGAVLSRARPVWDAATGAAVATLAGHTSSVWAVAFSPDGKRILTGSDDNTARLWDAATGATVATLAGHTSAVAAVAFLPDGKRVLTGSLDTTARLWDAATGAAAVTMLAGDTARVTAAAFSPDGKRVVTLAEFVSPRLWDAATGAALGTLQGHTTSTAVFAVYAVAFSPDGKRVLTGSFDQTARLWDAATGAAVATAEGHTGSVNAAAFSPDGKRILTGSDDGTARLWDAATGAAVATLVGHTAPVRAVAFSPDGNHVLTGSLDKTARLWSVFSAQDVVDEVKATVPRCMTPNEREHSHLHDASPRWCHARNLWPYLDHGPPEVKGSSPPYGPPSMSLDEKLIGFWDRWTGWLTGSDRQSPASTGLDLTSTGQRRGAAASRAN